MYMFSDSTAQYIGGKCGESSDVGIYTDGLQCVAVLIGAYNKQTGQPIMGVINQPFHAYNKTENRLVIG